MLRTLNENAWKNCFQKSIPNLLNCIKLRILIASNSFKECATSSEVNDCIEQGILLYQAFSARQKDLLEIDKMELCDGGTGFSSIMATASHGFLEECTSKDPLMRDIVSYYGVSTNKKEIFIEVAQTAGLALLKKEEQNPTNTTSYGVALQIIDAIDKYSPEHIYIGCGDTAVNDYGIGFLYGIGVSFTSIDNKNLSYVRPLDFLKVDRLNFKDLYYLDYLTSKCKVTVCCNLSSIIGGQNTSTDTYARQKGASDQNIIELNLVKNKYLDFALKNFNTDISLIPGSGAAGGLGATLFLFCNAKLTYSFEIIFKKLNISTRIEQADLIITGEGLLDANSLKGKAPVALALYAKKYNKKVALIAGAVTTNSINVLTRSGIDYVETLTCEYFSLKKYIEISKTLIRDASFRLFQKILN